MVDEKVEGEEGWVPPEVPGRDVDYDLEDELLGELPGGDSVQRTSALRDKIHEVRDNPDYHSTPNTPKWRPIASYGNSGSATGAQQAMRNYFGREGSGFTFATRTSQGRTVLYAKFAPHERKPGHPEPGNVPKATSQPGKPGRPKKVVEGNGEVKAENKQDKKEAVKA